MKQALHSAPAPHAIHCGDSVFLAGQSGADPAPMQLVDGVAAGAQRVIQNHRQAVVGAAGARRDHAVKVTVLLARLAALRAR